MKKILEEEFKEEDITAILVKHYKQLGYTVPHHSLHEHGVDIEARKNNCKTIKIEVKGSGKRPQQRVNYFLSSIGEVLQRMDDEKCLYYVALPNLKQYKKLWERLPKLAKERTKIGLILVSKDGAIEEYK